jgi:hypothetical protein
LWALTRWAFPNTLSRDSCVDAPFGKGFVVEMI